jgi:hypothetical protein
MFGWAMRGAVGFSGTLALGEAAKAYFEAGGDIAEILKSIKPVKKSTDNTKDVESLSSVVPQTVLVTDEVKN